MSFDDMLEYARKGDGKACIEAIKQGANVNFSDIYNHTALYFACLNNDLDFVKQLISAGANVNLISDDGAPLHAAVSKASAELVKFLVEHKADVNAVNNSNQTPLHLALSFKRIDIAQYLINKGANIHAKTITGVQPIHLACAEGYNDFVLWLLDNGVNVNVTNDNLKTPLHIVAEKNNLMLVMELLMRNASTTAKDIWGRLPVHCGNKVISRIINDHKPGMKYDDIADED